METPKCSRMRSWAGFVVISILVCSGCGDGGTGSEEEQTGATLQGQIILLGAAASQDEESKLAGSADPTLYLAFAPTSGVDVAIGKKSTKTDGNGSFILRNIPLGDQTVIFSGSGVTGSYALNGIVEGATFDLNSVQVNSGQVKTEHTGSWVGTAGSTESGSQGQIAFTLIIEANGNSLSGSGSVEAPDNSVWSMSGTETGKKVDGAMTLVSSNSSCATGATFTGTFSADTLSGTFTEVNPPTGCGSPESGVFSVVKQ